MNCSEILEWAGALADGEASPSEHRRAETHARGCPGCARRLREARALKAALRAVPTPPLPPELGRLLRDEARRADGARRRREPGPWSALRAVLSARGRAFGYGLATAGATAALMLVIGRGPAEEELSLEAALSAHAEYERAMALGDADTSLARWSEPLGQEER